MTDGQTVNTAESSNSGGATVMGNTEVTPTEKTEKPSQATKPSDDPIEEPSEPTEPDIKVTEPTDAPDEEKQDTGEHKTFIIEPGIHLIGSDVFAGTVNISAYSGTGSVYTTGGSLNIPNFGNEEGYTSSVEGIELKRGEYLTVSGNLNVKATYSVKYEKTVTAQLTATETVYTLSDMGGSAYSVMEEGGALKPGVYMIQAMEGNGFVYVPCRDAGGEVDFMIGVDGGYVDSINYVQLNEGDNVIIEGCTAMFIEMKEG